ncbi:MAG: NAD-dependent deacylase [Myxococcota bacterium]
MATPPIPIGPDTRILVVTGAGVSAESGIPTFRDANGLWENHPVEAVASPQGFAHDPVLVWRFYSERRAAAAACAPNAGHRALAELEARLGDRFLLVTQNVDDLHRRAGSERLVELHGNLFHTRCARCARPPFRDEALYLDGRVPGCAQCDEAGVHALLRPHIVWFGEVLDDGHLRRIEGFLRDARQHPLLFLAAGTSGVVYPAAALVDLARSHGAESWLVNADRAENAHRFDHFVQGRSGEVLPHLLAPGA